MPPISPKPLVYVAGPYTSPDPVENTHDTIKLADTLVDEGFSVIVPHLTMFWHAISPKPYEQWLEIDIQHVLRCDAVYRRFGQSSGADGEVEVAKDRGILVFYEDENRSRIALADMRDHFIREWGTHWRPRRAMATRPSAFTR
jgi:hypothetical protein